MPRFCQLSQITTLATGGCLSRFPFGVNVPIFRRLNSCVFSRLRPYSLAIRPPLTASRVISFRLPFRFRVRFRFRYHVGAALSVHQRPPPSFLFPQKARHIVCRSALISVSHGFPCPLSFHVSADRPSLSALAALSPLALSAFVSAFPFAFRFRCAFCPNGKI